MGNRLEYRALRARLLVGVAAAAMAMPLAGKANAQTAAAAKWSPWVEAGGMVGTRSFGDVDIFLPLWQDQGSLLFGDLRGTFSAQPTEEGNFGLGYRTQISPDWILGGYGYFDIANSSNNNLFYQVTLGVELKSVDWDFRLNGYIPINPDGGNISNNSNPHIKINGNTIQMVTESQSEKALYGFDGEVGWRVPLFPADGDFDVRLYAGGYYFTNSDVATIAGPRGRIEARLYDIDFLGLQSRLTAQGVVQWDSPRGVQGFGGLELRIPLGAITGAPGPKLNPLDRRMVDRVQRDVDIVTEKTNKDKKTEDVIVDELTVSTHTIVFANSGGAGSANGTQGNPVDLNGAPALAPGLNGGTGSNAIILADGGAGNISVTNPLSLLSGQALIGGGSVVPLTGVKSGKTVDFAFPGTRPTLVGTKAVPVVEGDAALIQMASGGQNEIFGLNLTGLFHEGILGQDMYRAIIKSNSIVDGTGDGIELGTAFSDGATHSSFIHIADNSITGMGENGIKLTAYISNAGTTLSQTVAIDDNTILNSSSNGIRIVNYAKTGGAISQALTIDPNTVSYNSSSGIRLSNVASVAGASISQTALIADNVIKHNGSTGIRASDLAATSATVTQLLEIDGNTVAYNHSRGIDIRNFASSNGVVSQLVSMTGDTAQGNTSGGIFVGNYVSTAGTIFQTVAISNSTAKYSFSSDGMAFFNQGHGSSAAISQTVQLEDVVVAHNRSDGIRFENDFSSGAGLSQSIAIDPSTITDNKSIGIYIGSFLSDSGKFIQNTSIADSTITANSSGGISIGTFGSSATITQSVGITGNFIANNGSDGIQIEGDVSHVATLSQTVAIAGNTVTGSQSDGIRVRAFGGYTANVVQTVSIAGNTVGYSKSSDGIRVSAFVDGHGAGGLTQSVIVSGNTVDESKSSGIRINGGAYSAADFTQSVTVTGNTVSDSRSSNGIAISTGVSEVANPATATVLVTGNTVLNSYRNGISIATDVTSATLTQSTLAVNGNTIAHARSGDGIIISNFVYVDGHLSQTVTVNDNNISYIRSFGILVSSFVSGAGASLSQVLTIDPNTIIHVNGSNTAGGILVQTEVYNAASAAQTISIADNFISGVSAADVANGVIVSNNVHQNDAYLKQGLTISNNTVLNVHGTDESAGGIFLKNRVYDDATLSQAVTIAGNSVSGVTGNYRASGIAASTFVSDAGTYLTQSMTISENTVSNISGSSSAAGIFLKTRVYDDASAFQSVNIANNTVSGVSAAKYNAFGIGVSNLGAHNDAYLSQDVTIASNVISTITGGSTAVGIFVKNRLYNDVTVSQNVAINNNSIFGVSGGYTVAGIFVTNFVSDNGSFLSQNLVIDPNTISNISASGIVGVSAVGIRIDTRAYDHASASQTIDILANQVSNVSAGNAAGIAVNNKAYRYSTINQAVVIAANSVSNIANGDGIFLSNFASLSSFISQGLTLGSAVVGLATFGGNTVTNAGNNGLYVRQFGHDSTISQHAVIVGNTFSNNGDNGIFAANLYNAGPGQTVMDWTMNSNHITNNTDNGIRLSNSGAGATQFVTLGSADIITANGATFDIYLINTGAAVGNLFFHTDSATFDSLTNSGAAATVGP